MLVSRKQEWELEVLAPQNKPQTTTSPKKSRLNVRLRKQCFMLTALVAVMMFVLTIENVLVVRSGYQLVQIKKELTVVDRSNEILKLEVARLKTPDRIQKIATEQLGLVLPQTVFHNNVSGN